MVGFILFSSLLAYIVSQGEYKRISIPAVIGSTFSPMNPFGVVIAQKVAELPFLSGAGFRMIILCIAFIWMIMVVRYANKNKMEKVQDENVAVTSLGRNKNRLEIAFQACLKYYHDCRRIK